MKRCYLLCLIVLLPACGSNPVAPNSDGRITETFSFPIAPLRSDGVVLYGETTPHIRVKTTGPLDAKASFVVVPGCEFEFSLRMPILLITGNLVVGSSGTGPELSLHRDVLGPGDYLLGMRKIGSCTLPSQGIAFPHTIVVTHS